LVVLKDSCGVWIIASNSDTPAEALAILDETERQRSARFARAADRSAFVTVHAALRYLLSAVVNVSPGDIKFATTSSGKPLLSPVHARDDINFSISRTAGFSAIAISSRGAIGVDIERQRLVPDHLGIAAGLFGVAIARQLAHYRDKEQHEIFLQVWTVAEAYVKATGFGLAGTEHFPVLLATDGTPVLLHGPTARAPWGLRTMALSVDCVGSIVVAGGNAAPYRSCLPEMTTLAALAAARPC